MTHDRLKPSLEDNRAMSTKGFTFLLQMVNLKEDRRPQRMLEKRRFPWVRFVRGSPIGEGQDTSWGDGSTHVLLLRRAKNGPKMTRVSGSRKMRLSTGIMPKRWSTPPVGSASLDMASLRDGPGDWFGFRRYKRSDSVEDGRFAINGPFSL